MKFLNNQIEKAKIFILQKTNPNLVLLILVIMFIVLLFAAENIVKLTLVQ
ncbi:MAG: hypothetical protein K8R53_13615 [Bacteroidales bacterium]|nr:hypothetical protein [Bacteroidales bacterium]